MANANKSHDIFLTIGGTKYGFMLAKDPGTNAKIWRVTDTPAMSVLSNQAGYGAYPPEQEIVVSQSDWREGMGWEFVDGRAVYKGDALLLLGTDARWKGKLMLGPNGTSTTLTGSTALDTGALKFVEFTDQLWHAAGSLVYQWNTTSSIWNAGTELTTDLTDLITHEGLMVAALGGSNNYKHSVDGTTWITTTQANNKADYFAAVGTRLYKAIKPNEVKWSTYADEIQTPAAPTYTSEDTGGSLDDGAVYGYKVAFMVGTGSETAGSSALSHDLTAGKTKITIGVPTSPTKQCHGRRIFRTEGGGSTYYHLADISDNTTTAYADIIADASLNTNRQPLTTSTALTPWSKAMTVGDKETDITGMIEFLGELYVGKEEGLYKVTADNKVVPVTNAFRYVRSTTNFSKMAVFQNKLFFKIGTAGLYVYDGNTIRDISWSVLAPNMDRKGDIGAIVPGFNFLYVIVQGVSEGAFASICTLREEDINGVTDYRWHTIMSLPSTDFTPVCGLVSNVNYTNPKLWIGSTNTGKPLNYILPVAGTTPDKDSGCTFFTTPSYFISSNYDMGFRNDDKIFLSVDIKYTLPAGNDIGIYYDIDNSGSFTQAGADITSGTSAIRYINSYGKFIKIALLLDSDSTSETPIIHGIAIRAILRPLKRKMFDFTVRVADNMATYNGGIDNQTAKNLAAQLKNADDPATQTAVVTLTDIDGTTHSVAVIDLQEQFVFDKVGKREERYFTVKAVTTRVA